MRCGDTASPHGEGDAAKSEGAASQGPGPGHLPKDGGLLAETDIFDRMSPSPVKDARAR